MLEVLFVECWVKLKIKWKLEREVDLIFIFGSVMIFDFRLIYFNGVLYLLEIIGYWWLEYLRKKFV